MKIIITNEKKTKQTKRNNKIEKQNVTNDNNNNNFKKHEEKLGEELKFQNFKRAVSKQLLVKIKERRFSRVPTRRRNSNLWVPQNSTAMGLDSLMTPFNLMLFVSTWLQT